ncbi:MAG: hypothetical protein DCC57_20885 [Chloroflexi bacterium]|nr:MAG: hypothetical protein DCC57_20885 [Chloroflexota bacterium]
MGLTASVSVISAVSVISSPAAGVSVAAGASVAAGVSVAAGASVAAGGASVGCGSSPPPPQAANSNVKITNRLHRNATRVPLCTKSGRYCIRCIDSS